MMSNLLSSFRTRMHERQARLKIAMHILFGRGNEILQLLEIERQHAAERLRVAGTLQLLADENPTCRIMSTDLKDVILGKHVVIHPGVILDKVNIADFSFVANNSVISGVDIGKYCSIGPDVKIGLAPHPSRVIVSTHPAFYSNDNTGCNTAFRENKIFDDKIPRTVLGHDVWIGSNAIVPGGIQIGTGAIVAAGSVVVKDVPPYAVVGGNPANVIRYRFAEDQIRGLLESQWWDWPIEQIRRSVDLFSDVEKFMDPSLSASSAEVPHSISSVEEIFTQVHRPAGNSDSYVPPPSNELLAEQLQRLTAENISLTQKIDTLTQMGVRARIRDLWVHIKQLKTAQLIRAVLWRIVVGEPMPPLPKITVITPVFNGSAHIAETLESVLRQDYPDLEYIVVDGGSTDGTLDIIRGYQSRTDFNQRIALVISEPDQGMYDALAKGFGRATGEIFCYLNADDLFECGGLRSVGEFFAQHSKTQVIYHEDMVHVNGWKYPNVRQPRGVDTVDLMEGHILFQDGVFWRRTAFEAVGGIRRDLKLAGDFDLWLRLSARFPLVKRPGHVSCFRVHLGQLSTQMDMYRSEMRQSIRDFMRTASIAKRMWWGIHKKVRPASKILARRLRHERLYFPMDYANMPPPEVSIPPMTWEVPRSPIDGKPADRLLFSIPDTRFGEREINYIYLDSRHKIAVTHPPIPADKLDSLYRKYYSAPPAELKLPPEGVSPYRQFDGKRLWEKVLFRMPIEKLARMFAISWSDNTLAELNKVLKAARIDVSTPLRFLDTGCFEGRLLDQIRGQTTWQAFGLEPNDHAVDVARAKGHLVWHGHAEHALEIIPQDQMFDVIFMGQSIEHVDDPVRVLRRLRQLLAPGGVLVMSTPNLDSREIDWFGPTWAHWHAPYHRFIFSRAGLYALAQQVGLAPVHFRSFSHPYWSAMSIMQNQLGLGASVSNTIEFEKHVCMSALRASCINKLLFDRTGRGDYIYLVMKDGVDD